MRKFKLDHIAVRELREKSQVTITCDKHKYMLELRDAGTDAPTCTYKRLLKSGKYSAVRPCTLSYPCWAFVDFGSIIHDVIKRQIRGREKDKERGLCK